MNSSRPIISVIVPVYNTGTPIVDCIESIISQTLREIEIIIIDDGSDDPFTLAVIDEFKVKDNRIRLIHKKNGGQSAARNAGLNEAKGVYVAFADHDDILNANMYETLFKASENGKIEVVECGYGSLPAYRVKEVDLLRRPAVNPCRVSIEQDKDFLVEHITIWKRIYRKDFLVENHLKFDDLLWGEDLLFSFKVLISANSVVFVDEVLYYHIEHENNTTFKLGNRVFDLFKAHDLLRDFLLSQNCLNTYKNQYVSRVLKDFLFGFKVVQKKFEKEFFLEVSKRIGGISLKKYKNSYRRSKKRLLGYTQKGDFEGFKRDQNLRKKRKYFLSFKWLKKNNPQKRPVRAE